MADHSHKWHDGSSNMRTSSGCVLYGGTHLDKECPLNEEVKGIEEVKYGEFGRSFPNNEETELGDFTNKWLPLYTPFDYSSDELNYFSTMSYVSNEETQEVEDVKEAEESITFYDTPIINHYMAPYEPPIPFPRRLAHHAEEVVVSKTMESLRAIRVNLPLIKEIRNMDDYAKHMKNLNQLPPKEKDTGSFILPYSIDFVILDMVEDFRMPIILGRPCLATAHTEIDVFRKLISLEVGNEKLMFNIDNFNETLKPIELVCGLRGEAHEFWASCDPYNNQCDRGDAPSNEEKKSYWTCMNDDERIDDLSKGMSFMDWVRVSHGKETATYGKIWFDEDVHDLRSVETELPAIVFNDALTSEVTLSCEPTKIISVNDLKTDSEIDNDKVNMPSFPSPEPTVNYFDDLDFFKDFENEFPAIVYDDAQTSKLDFLTEPTVSPQHIDEFDLKDETSLSECDEKEQNVLYFNDLFPFNVIYPDESKSDKDNDDDKIDNKKSLVGPCCKEINDMVYSEKRRVLNSYEHFAAIGNTLLLQD
ncbi:hypothetical protein Tco_0487978 [Tanacetum coccineum]